MILKTTPIYKIDLNTCNLYIKQALDFMSTPGKHQVKTPGNKITKSVEIITKSCNGQNVKHQVITPHTRKQHYTSIRYTIVFMFFAGRIF